MPSPHAAFSAAPHAGRTGRQDDAAVTTRHDLPRENPMSDILSKYADLGDGIVHYLTAGEGEPVVLLHGIPQTCHEWRHVIPRISDRFRVIAPDLRGLGDSFRPTSGYDKKTVASDVWRLVHDHLKIDRFFLVGHDWGGPTAFALACAHQEAVQRLAILDVAIPGDGADFSQNGRRWHHALFRTAGPARGAVPGPRAPDPRLAVRELRLPAELHPGGRPPGIPSHLSQAGAMRAMFGYYRALPQDAEDNKAFLQAHGKLRMPVLALAATGASAGASRRSSHCSASRKTCAVV